MKRLVSLLLALVLLTGCASAAFADRKQINKLYQDAVAKMSDAGVIGGFPDGTFRPTDTLTRAQAAKILCTVLEGADKVDAITATSDFADVPATHWASKYVGYCADKGIVSGVGDGNFNPDGKLTGCAFGKMLLAAYGHNAEAEGLTGAGWEANVDKQLKSEGRDYLLTINGDPLSRQEACQMVYNFTLPAADTSVYTDVTVDLKAETALYKTYGRVDYTESGLAMLWPGNSIEFTAECGGDLVLHYTAEESGYLQAFVDGGENLRARLLQSETERELVVATVRPGVHTVRIVRENDINAKGLQTVWKSLSFRGVKESVKAAEQKKLYIEYVGDSITSGKGVLSSAQYKADDPNHSATHSYAYLSAGLLDADYSMVSRGSCGFVHTSNACPKTMTNMYDYVNPFAADEALKSYDFTRKPDVIILALGTNDGSTGFKEAALAMIEQIRARNGKDVKIVIQYGMMTKSHEAAFPEIAKEAGCYSLKVTKDNSGGSSRANGTGHPGVKGQAKVAEELAAFLKTIL